MPHKSRISVYRIQDQTTRLERFSIFLDKISIFI
nr:MAG TPA: hypothetical protein [Bacteriophage sp.]